MPYRAFKRSRQRARRVSHRLKALARGQRKLRRRVRRAEPKVQVAQWSELFPAQPTGMGVNLEAFRPSTRALIGLPAISQGNSFIAADYCSNITATPSWNAGTNFQRFGLPLTLYRGITVGEDVATPYAPIYVHWIKLRMRLALPGHYFTNAQNRCVHPQFRWLLIRHRGPMCSQVIRSATFPHLDLPVGAMPYQVNNPSYRNWSLENFFQTERGEQPSGNTPQNTPVSFAWAGDSITGSAYNAIHFGYSNAASLTAGLDEKIANQALMYPRLRKGRFKPDVVDQGVRPSVIRTATIPIRRRRLQGSTPVQMTGFGWDQVGVITPTSYTGTITAGGQLATFASVPTETTTMTPGNKAYTWFEYSPKLVDVKIRLKRPLVQWVERSPRIPESGIASSYQPGIPRKGDMISLVVYSNINSVQDYHSLPFSPTIQQCGLMQVSVKFGWSQSNVPLPQNVVYDPTATTDIVYPNPPGVSA